MATTKTRTQQAPPPADRREAFLRLVAEAKTHAAWRKEIDAAMPGRVPVTRVVAAHAWKAPEAWTPTATAEALLAPATFEQVELDGDRIMRGRTELGRTGFDEAGNPALYLEPDAGAAVRKALTISPRGAVEVGRLAPNAGAVDPRDAEAFDQLIRVLDGIDVPAEDGLTLAQRHLDSGAPVLMLSQQMRGTHLEWRQAEGLVRVDEVVKHGLVGTSEEGISTHVPVETGIARAVVIMPDGRLVPRESDDRSDVAILMAGDDRLRPLAAKLKRSDARRASTITTEALGLTGLPMPVLAPVGRENSELYSNAALELSGGAGERRVSARIGWTEDGLVTSMGTLTPRGVDESCVVESEATPVQTAFTAEFTPPGERAESLQVPRELAEQLRELVDAAFSNRRALGWAVIGAAVAAPLSGLLDRRPAVWLVAEPEAGKTAAVEGVLGCLYGEQKFGTVLLDPSTAGVRSITSEVGPFAVLLDDYKPAIATRSLSGDETLEKIIIEQIGISFDGRSPARSKQDGYSRAPRPMSSTLIVTGEAFTKDPSRQQRLVALRLQAGDVNEAALFGFRSLAAEYMAWLASLAGWMPAEMAQQMREWREEYLQGRTKRDVAAIGFIYAALRACGWPALAEMSAAERAEWDAIEKDIAESSDAERRDASLAERIRDGLRQVLSAGEAHIAIEPSIAMASGTRPAIPQGLISSEMHTDEAVGAVRELGYARVERTVGGDVVVEMVARGKVLGHLSPDREHIVVPTAALQRLVLPAAGLGSMDWHRLRVELQGFTAKTGATPRISREFLPHGVGDIRGFALRLDALGLVPILGTATAGVTPINATTSRAGAQPATEPEMMVF